MNVEIITNNTLIAEFLGWTVCDCGKGTKHYKYGEHNFEVIDVIKMKFHRSWDQLHPVIDKIESLMPEIKIPEHLDALKAGTHGSEEYIDVLSLPLSSKIGDAYKAVVEFIKWYNAQL